MKTAFYVLTIFTFLGCSYPTTSFYVKNTSDKVINFKASIIKQSSMGPIKMTLPFTVLPNDSILARQVGYRTGANPTYWFSEFIIFPTDSVKFNNPKDSINWIKSYDINGKPQYIFNITKEK